MLKKGEQPKRYKYPPTQISYLDDILKEVFRKHKLKYDYKQCLEGVKFMFEYIVQETKNPEVFAIDLPYLGHLYKNEKFLINSKQLMAVESEEYIQAMDQIQQIKRFADENPGIPAHKKIPYSFSFEKFIKGKYEITDVCRKMYKQSYEVYAAVEDIQNKDYNRVKGIK